MPVPSMPEVEGAANKLLQQSLRARQVQLEGVAGPRHQASGAAVGVGRAVEAESALHRSVRAGAGAGVDEAGVVGGGEREVPAGQIRKRHCKEVVEDSEGLLPG